MTEEQPLEKFKFGSKELKEKTERPAFIIEGRELFKFEDKKPYVVEVETEEEVLSRETKFGLKYYVAIKVKGAQYFWQCSSMTLDTLMDSSELTNKFNVMLNSAEKKYSIVPLVDAE